MARWKKPTKEEILENRRTLAERARNGDLRLPSAVADIRRGFGMTQAEFAKTLGLSRRQVAEIEAGTANPTLETLEKIGRLFGFSVGFVPIRRFGGQLSKE
ncbi:MULTISPECIES: helix-turn-helix domain-containing protein [Brucella]|uniref:Helix-turn-helix domain protein n=1 Tax=Brucella lupini TaxID=255457 RepID=A0A256GX99_9HYPH|nr:MULTISPECIES: helix-turn-helix transcriptional regulator [Brucella]RNL43500.1 XRE family transcriptional regulator [Ochrobactrum sp. MH181795]KAB2704004.1 helix-turn-helix transcriptional regulator [Brucella lupini]KAB2728785.1 helix-turn-helix transcriptional regulator [Brucella anthropi]KAB2745957.1 helix-turn-helix transcriptional regulator [Brucella anthropi]KAB2800716.1 helix-turn-helix transcriptional regulator [Brucella anthropi]